MLICSLDVWPGPEKKQCRKGDMETLSDWEAWQGISISEENRMAEYCSDSC